MAAMISNEPPPLSRPLSPPYREHARSYVEDANRVGAAMAAKNPRRRHYKSRLPHTAMFQVFAPQRGSCTTKTSHFESDKMWRVTLPSRKSSTIDWPCLPMTMRSAPSFSSVARIT